MIYQRLRRFTFVPVLLLTCNACMLWVGTISCMFVRILQHRKVTFQIPNSINTFRNHWATTTKPDVVMCEIMKILKSITVAYQKICYRLVLMFVISNNQPAPCASKRPPKNTSKIIELLFHWALENLKTRVISVCIIYTNNWWWRILNFNLLIYI